MSVAIDPVCGMEVEVREGALAVTIAVASLPVAAQPGRTEGAPDPSVAGGERFWFCGRGCLLDFQDEPERYLDADFHPSGM
jgi:YHS domain-containing protein